MLSVLFVLAATLTLLPAVLAKLGRRRRQARAPVGARRRAPLAARSPPGPSSSGGARGSSAAPRVAILVALALPVISLNTGMPSIKVVPAARRLPRRLRRRSQEALGPGARRAPSRSSRRGRRDAQVRSGWRPTRASPRVRAGQAERRARADPGRPDGRPVSTRPLGATIDRLRATLPAGALVGGAAAENHDLEAALAAKTPLVIGVVLGLGFLLLLVALQAPLIAARGRADQPARHGRSLRRRQADLPGRRRCSGLLGFESQGFLDAWGPVFFFAMIFAISMDYTVFLLSSAKEHWDRSHDPHEAMVGGVAHSGRVIFAAAR